METIQIECPEGKKIVKTLTDNGVIITFEDINPNEVIDNKIKELEKQLTQAEKFVLDTISDAKPAEPHKDGSVNWYSKDWRWLFSPDFKRGYLWVGYNAIWSVLEKKYGLKNNEIQQLINNVMYKYTNNGQLTPRFLKHY
jgi:hypothetical protein